VDEGLIKEKNLDGKKVYFITENGKKIRDQSMEIINSFLHKKMSPSERIKILRILEILRRTVYNQLPFLTSEQLTDIYKTLEETNDRINNLILMTNNEKK